jgi:hypothetical protein
VEQSVNDLVARIGRLQADFQRVADVHTWVCLALPEAGRPFAFAGEAFGPDLYQQVRVPIDPSRRAVTDHVDSLTHEAERVAERMLAERNPSPILAKLQEEIRDWEKVRTGGGWTHCLLYAAIVRRFPRVENYPQVAASALRWLRDNIIDSAPIQQDDVHALVPEGRAELMPAAASHTTPEPGEPPDLSQLAAHPVLVAGFAPEAIDQLRSGLPELAAPEEVSAVEKWRTASGDRVEGLPATGWYFRQHEAACDGKPFRLQRPHWRILKLLVKAKGGYVGRDQLKEACSDSQPVQETLRGYISELRSSLRNTFNIPTGYDPIPVRGRGDDAAWALMMPAK